MRDRDNIRELCMLLPDFIGFIFYPGSARYVGENPDPDIFRIPATNIGKVGVFVDEDLDNLCFLFEKYHLDLVQLHGSETPEYCFQLFERGIPIIKTHIPTGDNFSAQINNYMEQVKYILFDTPSETYGGSGRKFNWDLTCNYSTPLPFFLSGGIGPDDVELIKGIQHDWFYAVDINSRFEKTPGIKEVGLIKRFIETLRR